MVRYPNVRAEMARNGTTVDKLAKLMGISATTLSDKLNGKQRLWFDEACFIRDYVNEHGGKGDGEKYFVDELFGV